MAENLGNIGETFVKIKADMNELHRDVNRLKSNMEREGQNAGNAFSRGFQKVMAIGGVILALKKSLDFAREAKNAARDAEEIRSKFDAVFSSLVSKANNMADEFSESFGVAKSTSRELLGSTGDLLVGFGFAEEKALDLSLSVNSLAQDLASFTNYSGGAKGASDALTKAILGETESAKSLGIVIRQNTKEFTAEVKAVQQAKGLTEQQAKAIVILDQAYRQSGKAVGDYARTKDSLANAERRLNEQYKEFQEDIGKELASTYKILINLIAEMSQNMGDSSSSLTAFGVALKSLATPTIIIMTLIKTFSNALGAFGAAVAHLVQGNFNAARIAISSGMKMQYRDFDAMSKAVIALWEDTSKKIGGMDMNLGGSGSGSGSGNKGGGADADFIKSKLAAYDKMYSDLRHLAWGYTDYRKQMIEEEYQSILKLTGDTVNAEAWKNEQLAQLAEERKAFFNEPLEDSMQSEFDFMDELIAKEDELAERKAENERDLAAIRSEIAEEERERQEAALGTVLGESQNIGNNLMRTFNLAGDSFIGKMVSALSIVQSIVSILQSAAAISAAIGALTSPFSFLFPTPLPLAHAGGNFMGTPNGVKKMASGGSFIVPKGFPNDSYPLLVESGERVSVTPSNRVVDQDRALGAIASRMEVMNMQLIDMQGRTQKIMGDFNIHGKADGRDLYFTNEKNKKIVARSS